MHKLQVVIKCINEIVQAKAHPEKRNDYVEPRSVDLVSDLKDSFFKTFS